LNKIAPEIAAKIVVEMAVKFFSHIEADHIEPGWPG
jgi:hypothetical protein